MSLPAEVITQLPLVGIGIVVAPLAWVAGWVHLTRMRIKHGYPLDGVWGQALHPKGPDVATQERLALLTGENAQLRAELGAVKDRLANVERIVTDSGYSLTREIEALRLGGGAPQ
ncbi:hypothetical protein [Novosphingobium sp. FKTRR1]|uniref:hypothetical protein n=1 Tax=unclassified Novosphingobium TaxID=2644732 RepID=UPI001CF05ED6|nr:hypothetical protein [Novosphingobium sp. FKTRR1]